MPLHLTPSHFRRQQRNTRGHTLAGRTARWTRPLTSNSQVPAAKKTQVSHCSRTGPAQPPKKTANTQIAVVAHFPTGPATQKISSSQIAVVALSRCNRTCHQKISSSQIAVVALSPSNWARHQTSSSQIAIVALSALSPSN